MYIYNILYLYSEPTERSYIGGRACDRGRIRYDQLPQHEWTDFYLKLCALYFVIYKYYSHTYILCRLSHA